MLLAAGLDPRAVRLSWAAGATVYEVDLAAVLAFEDGCRSSTARHRPVTAVWWASAGSG